MSEWTQVTQPSHPVAEPEKWQFEHWDTLFYCEERATGAGSYLEDVWVYDRLGLFLNLQAAGLLLLETDGRDHRIALTDKGWKWAQFLRQWKATNGTLTRVTLDHVLGVDAETMKRIGDLMLLSDMSVDNAMFTYGFDADIITGDQFRDKLYEHCGIQPCSDCGTWVDGGSVTSEDQCEDCVNMYEILEDDGCGDP